MSSSYDTLQFLLDHANIGDTVAKMAMYLDKRNFDGLANEVFAEELLVDYSSLLGTPVEKVKGTEQVQKWKVLTDSMDSFQHLIAGLVIELPQPGSAISPTAVKVAANYSAVLRRDSARGESLAKNGGRYELEVSRIQGISGNPWRIAFLKADVSWFSGNSEVMSPPK